MSCARVLLVAEVSRYEGKVETAGDRYRETNDMSKKEMVAAKKAHDQLIDMQLVTAIVTQVKATYAWCIKCLPHG